MKLATLCYVRSNGKTLMLHRIKKRNDMHAGKWNGLGGKLDPGETPEECVVREVREESGLELSAPVLRGVLTFPAFSQGEDWYAFVYVADRFTGELIDSAEGVLAWVDDDKLAQLNLWEGDRIFLPWLDSQGFFSGKFVYRDGRLVDYQVIFHGVDGVELEDRSISAAAGLSPVYTPMDDTYCWVCHGPVVKRQCKIICQVCGFTRDCSDP